MPSDCTCRDPTPPFEAVLDMACPVHGEVATQLVKEALERDKLIAAWPPDTCEFCGDQAELRPYGPKGERICFDCGLKDEPAMRRAFARRQEALDA